MSELAKVKITSIDANPLRKLAEYPYNADKITALRQSIHDVGLWEGVIGRKAGNRMQIAFGHHRIEAARQELGEDARVPIIVRDLSDEEMLGFMGRENLEDYNADFLIMLESWQAAKEFRHREVAKSKPLEIAIVLGWSRQTTDGPRMNKTAEACNAASELIDAGHLKRSQLKDLTVKSVSEICGHIRAQHKNLESVGKLTNRPAAEIEKAKKHVSHAGGRIAEEVRKGHVAPREIRGKVDVEAYRHAREAKQQAPLFAQFGARLADSIGDMLKSDTVADKLQEIKKSLNAIQQQDDIDIVKRIAFECEGLSERADKWHTVFSNPTKKVVALKGIK